MTADGAQRPSRVYLREIADELGISIATVSRAINGRPDVAPGTRAQVIERLRGREEAVSLAAFLKHRTDVGLVGITVPIMRGGYFSEILAGLTAALAEQNMRPLIFETEHGPRQEADVFRYFSPGAVDGVIMVLPSSDDSQLDAYSSRGYPIVVIDPKRSLKPQIPVVMSTHIRAGQQAAEHILGLGHRRVGLVTGFAEDLANKGRLSGIRLALLEAGLDPLAIPQVEGSWEFREGKAAAKQLFALPDRPTAIIAFSDAMAAGVMREAYEQGITVPRDLSVIGFDGAEIAFYLSPQLTTVQQPLRDFGRPAVAALQYLRQNPDAVIPPTELATALSLGASTTRPAE